MFAESNTLQCGAIRKRKCTNRVDILTVCNLAQALTVGKNSITLAVSNNRLSGYMSRPVSGLTSRAANECTGGIYGDVSLRFYKENLYDAYVLTLVIGVIATAAAVLWLLIIGYCARSVIDQHTGFTGTYETENDSVRLKAYRQELKRKWISYYVFGGLAVLAEVCRV